MVFRRYSRYPRRYGRYSRRSYSTRRSYVPRSTRFARSTYRSSRSSYRYPSKKVAVVGQKEDWSSGNVEVLRFLSIS